MATYTEEQKKEALKIQKRCREIEREMQEALHKQDLEEVAFLNLEIDEIQARMNEIRNSPQSENE